MSPFLSLLLLLQLYNFQLYLSSNSHHLYKNWYQSVIEMMERLTHLILFLTAFLMALASVDARVKSVFVFGDSLFDSGNNRFVKNCTIQANIPPYGSTYFRIPTGRFTDGRTVADFIAQHLKIKFQSPFQEYRRLASTTKKPFPANGINFASGGSGLLPDTNKNQGVASIQVQLRQLQSLVEKKRVSRKQITKSLFLLESGSNDIFSYFLLPGKPKVTPKAYVHSMLKEVAIYIHKIYSLGARRIAVFSVGTMGCIPARVLLQNASIDHCSDKVNHMAKYYNYGLEMLIRGMPRRYPGAVGVYGAVYNTIQQLRAQPGFHGFVNIKEACCGAGPLNGAVQCGLRGYKKCKHPHEYLFWDYFHPSEHTYELISNALWSGGIHQIRPMNLKTLVNITLRSHW